MQSRLPPDFVHNVGGLITDRASMHAEVSGKIAGCAYASFAAELGCRPPDAG